MKCRNRESRGRVLVAGVLLVACAYPAVSQANLCPAGGVEFPLGPGPLPEAQGTVLRTSVPRDGPGEHLSLEDLVDLAALDGLRVNLVDRLPPGKTGVTTGVGKGVRVLVSRRYPLFVQYSTLVHELVHVRHRQRGIHRHLSPDQRELQAFAAELAPENIQVLRSLACRRGQAGEWMLRDFLNDVAAHYWQHRHRAAREGRASP